VSISADGPRSGAIGGLSGPGLVRAATCSAARVAGSARRSPLPAALLGVLFTIVVVLIRPFDVAYRSWTLHVAIQTVAAVVCSVAAYLFLGRYRLRFKVADLVMALSLLILAVGGLCFSLLPAALDGGSITRFSTWAPVVTDVIAAAGFAVAAFTTRELRLQRIGLLLVGAIFCTIVVAIALVIGLVGSRLPVAISPRLSPVSDGRELLRGRPAILVLQLVSVVLLAASSFGFGRRARRDGDELIGMLSTATALGAVAAFNYFLFPSLYSQWVYSGDILRMAFYLVILAAIARELNSYWRGLGETAALEERRRIARDLHDGLAQELAFIANRSKLLEGERAAEVSSAAERALEESRRAIDALTRPLDEPLETAVQRAAEEVAIRFGAQLSLGLESGIEVSSPVRDALRRITREATMNAAQHGRASHLNVSLTRDKGGIRLRITDDGTGFDPAQSTRGFGLVSMSERAVGLGGAIDLQSRLGGGTTVEVVVP
jgi:signal transduction histidine kinase